LAIRLGSVLLQAKVSGEKSDILSALINHKTLFWVVQRPR
jgi:hypothetical protein